MKKLDNRLKEIRGVEKQKDVAEYLKRVEPRIDVTLLSKIENGIVLPTKPVLIALCLHYKTTPQEIFKRGVLSLASALKNTNNDNMQCVHDTYSFTVKLPNEFREKLTDEKLKECGYQSRADWIMKAAAEMLTKKKEPAPTDSIKGIVN